MTTLQQTLLDSKRACLISPAGTGKTWTIAAALKLAQTPQLVLTHTYAGVAALRAAARGVATNERMHRIDTIAGWMVSYVTAYPGLAGIGRNTLDLMKAGGDVWGEVTQGAIRLLSNRHIQRTIAASYDGVFIDEYQDCTTDQHEFVMALAEICSVRLLGDPLQGIFDFGKTRKVDFHSQVFPHFPRIVHTPTPHRWIENGETSQLGQWLQSARLSLEQAAELDISDPCIAKYPTNEPLSSILGKITAIPQQTFMIITSDREQANDYARCLKGYSTIEELQCKKWLAVAEEIDQKTATTNKTEVLLRFVDCFCLVFHGKRNPFSKLIQSIVRRQTLDTSDPIMVGLVASRAEAWVRSGSPQDGLSFINAVECTSGVHIYRADIWNEVKKTLAQLIQSPQAEYATTAWAVRQNTRFRGREIPRRVVSTPLLLKGLECDHVVIPNLEAFKGHRQLLYVALSRARKSLTICSNSKKITLAPPSF